MMQIPVEGTPWDRPGLDVCGSLQKSALSDDARPHFGIRAKHPPADRIIARLSDTFKNFGWPRSCVSTVQSIRRGEPSKIDICHRGGPSNQREERTRQRDDRKNDPNVSEKYERMGCSREQHHTAEISSLNGLCGSDKTTPIDLQHGIVHEAKSATGEGQRGGTNRTE